MAKRRIKESMRAGELHEEVALRREVARFRRQQLTEHRKSMLATYGAADKGRLNRDWRASPASADMSIIPDSLTLNARGRQCVRDSWIGESVIRAFSRNVVGCGILPVPMVRDRAGKFLTAVNNRLLKLFWAWASKKKRCDVEKRQSFWQKQNLVIEEWVTVGEGILVWSYQPSPDSVGLKLQSFEPEQFDLRIQSYTDPATGISRQVRGGVEVDEQGAPVAYHFYTRNPNDYLPVLWNSVRIPEARVMHFFKQKRVLQVRGVTQLAPILQDVRDFNRLKSATLWRAIMESCIGGVITTEMPGTGNALNYGTEPGAAATTPKGKRTLDFTPGMVPELGLNEKFESFIPTTPGNTYDPFTKSTIRGIGAGTGLSFSQVGRQSESNYSAARQDMLEDRKEFEPIQEMLAHNIVLDPVWPLFVRFAVLERKLDDLIDPSEFFEDPDRFCEAEYVAPAAPWIDPKNEAEAYEKLIELGVMDREELAHLRGRRLDDIWDKRENETKLAAQKKIPLKENKDDPEKAFKREVLLKFIEDGTVSGVVANLTALGDLVQDAGLPRSEYKDPFLPVTSDGNPLVTGEVIKNSEGDVIGAKVEKAACGAGDGGAGGGEEPKVIGKTEPGDGGVGEGTGNSGSIAGGKVGNAELANRLKTLPGKPKPPPKYRDGDAAICCGTCSYLDGTACTRYSIEIELDRVCDAWAAKPVSRDDTGGRKPLAPWKPDGEKPLDQQFASNLPNREPPTG
jgi:lambda family phage portal protein